MDREILSGTLTITGAEITAVLMDRQTLKETDLSWGIPSVSYGLDRGLEGENPSTTLPFIGSDDDLLVVNGNQVRFWLSTSSDIDDFRVLIQYPEEHQSAHLGVVFWHLRGRDVEGYPVTTPGSNGETGGIVVGSIVDDTPDDGDYGEILSIGQVRLKTEDLDIQEDELHLGTVDHNGGVLGPASFTVDNFLNEIDYDEDNEPDQNGLLNPVPNQGALEQLKVLTTPLQNDNGDFIPVEQIQVLGIPAIVEAQSIQETLLSVTVSPNTPPGNYRGFLTMWEDNDLSDTIEVGEPMDNVLLSLEVIPADRADIGVIVPDMQIMMDASDTTDAANFDAQIEDDQGTTMDASSEMQQETGISDSGSLDMNDNTDALLTDDSAVLDQSVSTNDSADNGDRDSEPQGIVDAAMTSTDTETWPGVPQGGGLGCNQAPLSKRWALLLFLVTAFGRRRC